MNSILKLLFFCLLVSSANTFASTAPPRLNCSVLLGEVEETARQLLSELLPAVANGEIQAEVGVFKEYPALLAASKMPPSERMLAQGLLQKTLAANKDQASILGNMARTLSTEEQNSHQLILCILGESCELKQSSAIHIFIKTDFSIVPFHRNNAKDKKIGGMTASTEVAHAPRFIIAQGGRLQDSLTWASRLTHELIHFADMTLITSWLRANQQLLASGKNADELFLTYVRNGEAELEIDEGFLRIFLESRAYSGQAAFFAQWSNDLRMNRGLRAEMRRRAFADILDFQSSTRHLTQKLKINDKNILEFGERWGQLMQQTIARASQL